MPAWVGEWLPLIAVAGLAGIFNLIVASEKFNRKFRSPFFTPWTSIGLWWWVLIQLSLPTIFFWLLFGSAVKLSVTPDLVTKAITFGLGFTPFVNANIDLGFAGVPLGDFYFALTQLAYRQIAASQVGRLADFKTDLRNELSQHASQLELGLNHLKGYFEGDPSLRIEEERKLLERFETARSQTAIEKQIDATVSLILEVRSRDYPRILQRFGCNTVLQTYFPKKAPRSNMPKP
jgi:hypothetical protein